MIGLLGVVCMYAGVAGTVSVATPWISSSDSKQHIDYVWRVYHGELPRWEDGLRYPAFTTSGYSGRQAASANPPLFYVVHAPFVGPLLARGNLHAAIGVGRVINLLIGVGCIAALAWGGWLMAGRRRALFAVAVPALGVLMYRFTRLNQDYALDPLLVLFSTLSLILSYKLVYKGPNKKLLVWLVLLSCAGMLTKVPYILFVGLNLLAVGLHYLIRYKHNLKKVIFQTAGVSVLVVAAITITSGWFYYLWNYKTNGSPLQSSPLDYSGGRSFQSLSDVLLGSKLWGLVYAGYARYLEVSLAVLSFCIAGCLSLSRKELKGLIGGPKRRSVLAIFALAWLGVSVIQIKLAFGYGSINFRYLLSALLPMGLLFSFGLLQFRNMRGQLVTLAACALGVSSLMGLMRGHLGKLHGDTAANGLPGMIVTLLLLLFAAGTVLLSWSLFKLSDSYGSK